MRVLPIQSLGIQGCRPRPYGWAWRILVLVVGSFLVAWGCSTTGHAPDNAAVPADPPLSDANRRLAVGTLSAVEIRGQPMATVRETVESVHTEAGFSVAKKERDQLVFERAGTRQDRVVYGNWFREDVKIRFVVEFSQQGSQVIFVSCRSYIVRDAGTYAEDQQKLARRRVRQFAHLLTEVANRLN
ncbi:MAG: hypothetical protein JNK85_25870 [Verrucomicrobiales bacterium]|nr:hypothetical protein [Verrucomicrobiales bacterium]